MTHSNLSIVDEKVFKENLIKMVKHFFFKWRLIIDKNVWMFCTCPNDMVIKNTHVIK